MTESFAGHVQSWLRNLQDTICHSLEQWDGTSKFHEDNWTRAEGGGGRTRVLENPSANGLFEKAGVNFSAVHGPVPAFLKEELSKMPGEKGMDRDETFLATGLSLVIHPISPHVPIVHMNVRYFQVGDNHRWFGGGIDLTPAYVVPDDARHFHHTLKGVCDKHQPSYYPKFKSWADDYFFIPHRNETRGIGGIFFDRLGAEGGFSLDDRFAFVRDVGETFIPLYGELVNRNRKQPYTPEEKNWQLLRRSRYAEFNLVYDRGTRFGLETGGRTESILMSLPPLAMWKYNVHPEKDSKESQTLEYLKKGIDWTGEEK